jgi:hypothetical protein
MAQATTPRRGRRGKLLPPPGTGENAWSDRTRRPSMISVLLPVAGAKSRLALPTEKAVTRALQPAGERVLVRNRRWRLPAAAVTDGRRKANTRRAISAFCTGTALSARSVRGAQNGIFCRAGYFWRIRGGVQRSGTVSPGRGRFESGLRDRRPAPDWSARERGWSALSVVTHSSRVAGRRGLGRGPGRRIIPVPREPPAR